MPEMYFSKEDILNKSLYDIAHDLKEKSAPINFNTFKINLEMKDIEISGDFECHQDIDGGLTYIWEFWE